MPEAPVARHLVVHGRVQGVAFRAWLAHAAEGSGVAGSAMNRPDGTVEVVLEGPADMVARLERAANFGPPAADVSSVEAADAEPTGATGFLQG